MGKRALDAVDTTGVRSPQPKARKATSSEEAASGAAAIDQADHDKAVVAAAPAAAAELKLEVPSQQPAAQGSRRRRRNNTKWIIDKVGPTEGCMYCAGRRTRRSGRCHSAACRAHVDVLIAADSELAVRRNLKRIRHWERMSIRAPGLFRMRH